MEVSMEINIIDRPIKLDIKDDDSELLKAVKKSLKGYTTTKLRGLFCDDEDNIFNIVLNDIENSQISESNSIHFMMLLDKISLFGNAKSLLDVYNITKRR
jgi:hypothetical protein